MKKYILFLVVLSFFYFPLVKAASLGERLSGKILLDVEKNGEAWYVYPENKKRYYLGRPNDAFRIMRELSIGISDENLQKIEVADNQEQKEDFFYDINLTKRLSGKILLQVEQNGEAWYIYPGDLKRYYLGRPEDAFLIMRKLSLGISRIDLASVHKPSYDESLNEYSKYEYRRKIQTANGEFVVDVIEINLDNPKLKIITDTADDKECQRNCQAESLAVFATRNKGFAAINATYFDTSAAKKNYSFYPVYNSNLKKMINEDNLKYWTTGPIMAFDVNNNFYYFKDSREFKNVQNFEEKHGVKLQAALGNKPRLIENKMNLLIEWDIDEKQRNVKSNRNALAYKKDEKGGKGFIYLVIARQATIPELAEIMKTMDIDYALNLDGGYSSAMYYNDEYMVGPGRNIINAIIFSER